MAKSKYGNRITVIKGVKFHSQKEALRWIALQDMEKHGEIEGLSRQVPFTLIVEGVVICKLVIDFHYIKGQREVAEDTKGYQTAESKLKMKLAAALRPEVDWRLS
jgi:hypothetical protein